MKYEKQALLGLVVLSWSVVGFRTLMWEIEREDAVKGNSPVPVGWLLTELNDVYVSFEHMGRRQVKPSMRRRKSTPVATGKVDLNTADSARLERMAYIGPWLASRICRFRQALGGFHDVEQLREVWGLREENADKLIPKFHVGTGVFRWLCVDTASWASLRRHPYISNQQASAIERYRKHHPLDSIGELAQSVLLTDSMIRRWSPYLRLCESRDQFKSPH